MVNDTVSYYPKYFPLKALSNYFTFAWLTAGFFTFDMSWNLSTNLLENPMSYNAYLQGGPIRNKGGVGLFQISQKWDFFISFDNQVLLGVISQCDPTLPAPSKKGLSLSFSLAKKRIHVDTQLKGGLTNLFSHKQSRNRMMNTFCNS